MLTIAEASTKLYEIIVFLFPVIISVGIFIYALKD